MPPPLCLAVPLALLSFFRNFSGRPVTPPLPSHPPRQSGGMQDPNADLIEIFDTIESLPSAPKRLMDGFGRWLRCVQGSSSSRLSPARCVLLVVVVGEAVGPPTQVCGLCRGIHRGCDGCLIWVVVPRCMDACISRVASFPYLCLQRR